MLNFLKYFGIAFVGQLVVNAFLILLLEMTGTVIFGWIPFFCYFFVSERIAHYWSGGAYYHDELTVIITGLIPITIYSLIFASASFYWRINRSKAFR